MKKDVTYWTKKESTIYVIVMSIILISLLFIILFP